MILKEVFPGPGLTFSLTDYKGLENAFARIIVFLSSIVITYLS